MPYCPAYEPPESEAQQLYPDGINAISAGESSTKQPASAAGSGTVQGDESWGNAIADAMERLATPAAQETGEWRLEYHKQSPSESWLFCVALPSGAVIARCENERDAQQIVRDHNEHQSLSAERERLREALLELKCRAEFALTTPGFIRGRGELRRAIEAIRPDDVFDAALNEQGKESQ